MSRVIYYFSGTGNSLKVARDVAALMEDTEVIRIDANSMIKADSTNYSTIGVVFPVYYYGLPKMVKEFIGGLELNLGTYIFSIATCGGSVGAALGQLETLLENKGLSLSASYKVKMPDNFQIMYSPPPLEKQNRFFNEQEDTVVSIAKDVKQQITTGLADEGRIKRYFGNSLYKIFKPNTLDKNFWTDDKCNGCGICTKVCPANNISICQERPSWRKKCELCLACMHWCPQISIQYKKGTIKRSRYHHPKVNVSEMFNKFD